jgi:hypothetical protein
VVGDWNGDGFATVGVFPHAKGIRNSSSAGTADVSVGFGACTDIPVTRNWDGSGGTTIGVWHPSAQYFYLSNSNTSGHSDYVFQYGSAGDVPVTGDSDGYGATTIGVGR